MTKQSHSSRWITISLLFTLALLNWGCASKVQPTEVVAKQTASSLPVEQKVQTPQGALEITNVSVSKPSFNPAQGDGVQLSYALSRNADVTVRVYDPDHYLAQNLIVDEFQQAGSHKLIWDGKDIDGNIVPDQAYFFTIEARDASRNTAVYDPTTFSGGEEYDITGVRFDREANTVAFNLPKGAWVRGWFGIRKGPLVKLLLDWEPRPAGENIVFWDGKDQDGVANVFEHKDFVYRILTNTFPENSVIVTAERDKQLAQKCAAQLGEAVWKQREEFKTDVETASVDEAISKALKAPESNVFISDSGDNITAGGAGDIPLFVEGLLKAGAPDAVVAGISDPEAVARCVEVGKGVSLTIEIGGKLDKINGSPLSVTGKVIHLSPNLSEEKGPSLAVLRVEGVDIVLTSTRQAFTTLESFHRVGIDALKRKIVVVKLGYLFPQLRDNAPRAIMALSPGFTDLRMEMLPFQRVRRPIFPLDKDFTWQA
ncbi:MlrC C-terminal domain-containing protein [bacterium]|nr:MlrC C-terminal domain-containing protein [bacterium]